jgi:hypothetical protein
MDKLPSVTQTAASEVEREVSKEVDFIVAWFWHDLDTRLTQIGKLLRKDSSTFRPLLG